MIFDELDEKMRQFETAMDYCVLPGIHIVVRLDGRSFTRLTKEQLNFTRPFDERFRDLMLLTVEHLMGVGVRVVYGYTQSDEISLLLHLEDNSFNRKTRKLETILAGEASAKFSLALGSLACFDARVCQLPTRALVIDYFRWRNEDAHRNALNAHCYWSLRDQDQLGADAVSQRLLRMSVAEKNELLFARGVNFNDLPAWQKRGCGVTWKQVAHTGVDPRTGVAVETTRRRLVRDLELPMRDEYSQFIADLLDSRV
jgi:tRNA(His) guanylyltransferase